MEKLTKTSFQRYLDEVGLPDELMPKHTLVDGDKRKTRLGQWLRRTDPTAFDVMYNEWRRRKENGTK
jgi:hypothetical protein